jgi:hypothetical protein
MASKLSKSIFFYFAYPQNAAKRVSHEEYVKDSINGFNILNDSFYNLLRIN